MTNTHSNGCLRCCLWPTGGRMMKVCQLVFLALLQAAASSGRPASSPAMCSRLPVCDLLCSLAQSGPPAKNGVTSTYPVRSHFLLRHDLHRFSATSNKTCTEWFLRASNLCPRNAPTQKVPLTPNSCELIFSRFSAISASAEACVIPYFHVLEFHQHSIQGYFLLGTISRKRLFRHNISSSSTRLFWGPSNNIPGPWKDTCVLLQTIFFSVLLRPHIKQSPGGVVWPS